MEATFSFLFWAMYSAKGVEYTYFIEHLCPWGRAALEWGGLCSHNPLTESLGDWESLTPEAREEKARQASEKKKESAKRYREANTDKVKESQKLRRKANADMIEESSKLYRKVNADRLKESAKLYREANADKIKESAKLYREINADKRRESNKRYKQAQAEKKKEARIREWQDAKRQGRPTYVLCKVVFGNAKNLVGDVRTSKVIRGWRGRR
jgi:hypothetical protein